MLKNADSLEDQSLMNQTIRKKTWVLKPKEISEDLKNRIIAFQDPMEVSIRKLSSEQTENIIKTDQDALQASKIFPNGSGRKPSLKPRKQVLIAVVRRGFEMVEKVSLFCRLKANHAL